MVSLDKPDKFWSGDKNQNIDNYRKSKAAVAELFKYTDVSLYSLLEKIRRGEDDVIATVVNETNKALQQASR